MKSNNSKVKAFSLIEISLAIIIIGILIAGIYQAIEMFSEASLKSARSLSKQSRVARVDDLSLWLDATSQKAFDNEEKDDGSVISIWKDTNPKSISPTSFNSASASFSPSYVLSAINSLPVVRFNKISPTVGNCITISNQSFENNSEDFTLFLIYSPITLDDGIILEKNNATATKFPFSLELNSGFYKFSVNDSTTTLSVFGSKQAKINTPNLIRLSRTKGSQIEIAINGVTSSQNDTLTSSTLNNAELAVGCKNGTTPANFINGNFGEITFFNRNLSSNEKTEIEEYLYKKWKIKKYEGELASQEYLPCTVSALNAEPTITSVMPTKTAKNIACNYGYSGSISYKCDGGTFSVLSNSCTAIPTCTVGNNLTETYSGTNSDNSTRVNLQTRLSRTTLPFEEAGTLNYIITMLGQPDRHMSVRYKCIRQYGSYTLQLDIEKGCDTSVGVTTWDYYPGTPIGSCCSGARYSSGGHCNWGY